MSIFNFPSAATVETMAAAQSAEASFNGPGVDLLPYEGPVLVVQNGGAGTGTLDGKIQDSADNVTFADVAGLTFTQKGTAAGIQSLAFQTRSVRRYVRYVGTIVTGPQLVAVQMAGFRKIV